MARERATRRGAIGWTVTGVLLAAMAAFSGAAAWTIAAVVLPAIDDGLDEYWPPAGFEPFSWFMPGFIIAAVLVGSVVMYAGLWTRDVPMLTPIGRESGEWGTCAGLLVVVVQIVTADGLRLGALIALGVALAAAVLAWRSTGATVGGIRAHRRERERLARLHAAGSPVRGDVRELRFLNAWLGGAHPIFEVTAAYDTPSGRQVATGHITTAPEDAPMVGGTVHVWFLGDGRDTDDIDMDADPQSPRDPDAVELYTERGL